MRPAARMPARAAHIVAWYSPGQRWRTKGARPPSMGGTWRSSSNLIAVKDELLKFLRGLRAVREYTSDPVPDDVIREIVEVGRWTSTGGNRQPSEVVVVRDTEVKQKFADWG